jgi:hypothetical protein
LTRCGYTRIRCSPPFFLFDARCHVTLPVFVAPLPPQHMPRQMDRPAGSLPASVSTWFSAQEPGLLDSRAVRRHLEPYSPHTWPKVTRLTLLYGVAALRKAYGQQPLSVGELEDVVGTHAHAHTRTRTRGGLFQGKHTAVLRCSVVQSRTAVCVPHTHLSPSHPTAQHVRRWLSRLKKDSLS